MIDGRGILNAELKENSSFSNFSERLLNRYVFKFAGNVEDL